MLNWLYKIVNFKSGHISGEYKLIRSAVKSVFIEDEIINIYYLGGTEYSVNKFLELKEKLTTSYDQSLFDSLKFNTLSDNIDIYFVELRESKTYLLFTLSAFDYVQNDKYIDHFEINYNFNKDGFKKVFTQENSN
jgi:hypothetical protein